jgi:putative oxidoreductase
MHAGGFPPTLQALPQFFATFASGPCGYGLLVLRLVLATSVITEGTALLVRDLTAPAAALTLVCDMALVLCGTFILLGLLTAVVPTIVATVKLAGLADLLLWQLSATAPSGPVQVLVLQLAIAASLLLIGPGAYSVDARLFGRHEIHIPPGAQFPTR